MIKEIKKLMILGFAVCVIIIAGCGKNEENEEQVMADSSQLVLGLAQEYCDSDNMIMAVAGDDYFDSYCMTYYGLSDAGECSIDEGAVIYSYDGLATEIAVIKKNNKVSAEAITEGINSHLENRKGVYTGYFPSEEEKINNAVLFTSGEYVVLIVSSTVKNSDENTCRNKFKELCSYKETELEELDEKTAELFQLYISNRADRDNLDNDEKEAENNNENEADNQEATEEITEESQLLDRDDSTYYNQEIVTAYLTGNASLLTDDKDIFILNEVKRIIEDNITDDMTNLEKEKAIHDYICINMDYDEAAVEIEEKHLPDSDNPYGMLSEHYGICSGYSSTFKLFMDCLEIPCIIVEGKANNFADDHAWNKVLIDDKWYNVDVTWDDPVYTATDGKISTWYENYDFLNCSDKKLRETSHQWNSELYPESDEGMEIY